MQLLRDNLTLWTSSETAEHETPAEATKDAEKPVDEKTEEAPAAIASTTAASDAHAHTHAPAATETAASSTKEQPATATAPTATS